MIGFVLILVFCRAARAYSGACAHRPQNLPLILATQCCIDGDSYEKCCVWVPGLDSFVHPNLCEDYCTGTLPNGLSSSGPSDPLCQARARCDLNPSFADCCYTFDSDRCKNYCVGGPGNGSQDCDCFGFGTYGSNQHCCGPPFFSTSHPNCIKHCKSTYATDINCGSINCVSSPTHENCCKQDQTFDFAVCSAYCSSSSASSTDECQCETGGNFSDCCPSSDYTTLTCGGNWRYNSYGGYCSNGGAGGVTGSASLATYQNGNCEKIGCAYGGGFGPTYEACCKNSVNGPSGAECLSFCAAGGYDYDGFCITTFCALVSSPGCASVCPIRPRPSDPFTSSYPVRVSFYDKCETCAIRQTYAQCCPGLLPGDCTNFASFHVTEYACGSGGGSFSSCCGGGLNHPSCGGTLRFTPETFGPYKPKIYEWNQGGFCSKDGQGGFDSVNQTFRDNGCAVLICATADTNFYDDNYTSCCGTTGSPECVAYLAAHREKEVEEEEEEEEEEGEEEEREEEEEGEGGSESGLTGCSALGETACTENAECSWSADTKCTAKSAESSPAKPFPWFIIVIVVVVVVLVVALVVTLIVLKKNKKACFEQDEGEGESKQKELTTVENGNTSVADTDAESSGAKADASADDSVVRVDAGAPVVDVDADVLAPDTNTVGSGKAKSKPSPKAKSKAGPKAKSEAHPKAKVDADTPVDGDAVAPADGDALAPDTNTVGSANAKSKPSPKAKSKAGAKDKSKALPQAKVDADTPADGGVDTNTVKSANAKSKASPKGKSKAGPNAKSKANPKK